MSRISVENFVLNFLSVWEKINFLSWYVFFSRTLYIAFWITTTVLQRCGVSRIFTTASPAIIAINSAITDTALHPWFSSLRPVLVVTDHVHVGKAMTSVLPVRTTQLK